MQSFDDPLLRTVRTTRRPGARGFSLIELMVVVALVAILLVLAVPAFRNMIQINRVAGEVNSFSADLQYARSEAIQRGVPVSLCPSSDGATCLGTNTWHSGWIVFVDYNGSGTMQTGDVVLRPRAAWTGGDTFVASPSTTAVTYGGQGFAINLASVTVTVHTSPSNNKATRCLALNSVGRQVVQTYGVGLCT